MGTLLKVLTVFVLLLSIAAFVLGLANFNKRENLIGRTHELEQAVIGLANFIEDPGAVRVAAAAEDDDLDVDAAAAAAEDEAEDVEHVSWDVDQVDAQPNDAPAMSDFWDSYKDSLEKADFQTLDFSTRDKKDQLMTFYAFDWVSENGKRKRVLRRNAFDQPVAEGPGTMHDLLKDMQSKAKYQLQLLGETRIQLRTVREQLEEVAALLNKEKKEHRASKQEIVRLNEKIAELEGKINQQNLEIARLEREKSELQDRITALEEEVAEKDQRLAEANNVIEQQKEEIRRLRVENITSGPARGGGGGGGGQVKLSPGVKGKIARVNAENAFVIVELTPEAVEEILPGGEFPAPVDMMVRRKGADGADEIVTRIRITAPPNAQNLAIADNVYGWQQTATVEVGDEVVY